MVHSISGVEVREKSIRITFTWDGKPCRETLKVNGEPMKPTQANIKHAHRMAAEVRAKIRMGTFVLAEYFPYSKDAGPALTVAAQLDHWLESQRIATSTRRAYESAIRFWVGQPIGAKILHRVVLSDIRGALASKPAASAKTISNYTSVLRAALELAKFDRLIEANPLNDLRLPKHQKPQPDPFSQEEMEAILTDMHSHYAPAVADLCEFKFWTGLRSSEAFGLRWPDVDLRTGVVMIQRGIVANEDVSRTKTSTGRIVKLNSRALATLKRQKTRTFLQNSYVWIDPRRGTEYRREQFFTRFYWLPTLKRLGMRHRPPYNTRHTYATLMLMSGMTPAFCAKQLGHSVQVFLSTYSRWLDGSADDAEMAKLETTMKMRSAA